MRMRFSEGLTMEEVGRRCGVTKQRIEQIQKRVIDELRRRIAVDQLTVDDF